MGQDHRPPADICDIVTAFAGRPDASVEQIVDLYSRLQAQGREVPAVPGPFPGGEDLEGEVRCLVCGRGFKMLKRHLRTAHAMSEMDYRIRYGLPEDRPLVAPEYSRRKAAQAREAGLGRRAATDLT